MIAATALAALALAQAPEVWDPGMTEQGRAELRVATVWQGAALSSVLRCPAGATCTPAQYAPDGTVDVSRIAAGDTFEAHFNDGSTIRTPAWQGAPRVIAKPALRVDGKQIRGTSPARATSSLLRSCRCRSRTSRSHRRAPTRARCAHNRRHGPLMSGTVAP